LVVAGVSRFGGVGEGLPYTYYADEVNHIQLVQGMLKTGDLNPHYFYYPSGLFYLNALIQGLVYAGGVVTGYFSGPDDLQAGALLVMGVGITPQPWAFWVGRGLTATFGVGAVGLMILIGRRLTGDLKTGLVAALMLAISPTHSEYSRYLYPHVILTFLLMLAFWCVERVRTRGQLMDYWLSGAAIGLATATMYHGAIMFAGLAVAHFLRVGLKGWRDVRLYQGLAMGVLVFVILNPFMLLDSAAFIKDSVFIISHYLFASGGASSAGMGNALWYYLDYLWRVEGAIALIAALELIRCLRARDRAGLLVFGFSVPFFVLISLATARNPRTVLPVMPFFILSSAAWLTQLAARLVDGLPDNRKRVAGGLIVAGVALATLWTPTVKTVQATAILLGTDSREMARMWIEANVETGSRLAVEAYSPYPDPTRYDVQGFVRAILQTPDWYIDNGFDYLIFSENMFGRYFAEPDLYRAEVDAYSALFNRFDQVASFDDGAYEIRIYSIAR